MNVRFCISEGVAYTFGHSGGLITYSFPDGEWPDTRSDRLALGFVTTQRNAVLVRVVSGSSNDFIEMELVSDGSYRLVAGEQQKKVTSYS